MDAQEPKKHKRKHKDKDKDRRKSKTHEAIEKPKKRKRHSHTVAVSPPPKKPRTATSNSPYHIKTTSLYLSLPPRYSFFPERTFNHLISATISSEAAAHLRSLNPITGVEKHHLDPLLMRYYEPVDGVIIAYKNVRFETSTAKIIAESPFAHVWTTVDLLIWRPRKGMVLQGWANLQSASHIGLLVDNTWNVSIPQARIPSEWEWKEEGGMWTNKEGENVEGALRFMVEEVKAGGRIFSMEGSLLDEVAIRDAQLSEVPLRRELEVR